MLVIGTAGHIDHGKSSIVKRLTDTDPDRLPEEKKRGMTIDLGFAFYNTHQNETVAFIDVPGHERFVKNMVAGAGGIDSVLMVVAADDGWMPQSEEHFQIVRLLNVRHGAIAINKIDLADEELIELLEIEIKEKVAGTFLEDAPIFKLSAETGEGFNELEAYLNEIQSKLSSKKNIGKPRLYIDRSFIRPGIGGVVTGTLRGGELKVGQNVNIFPSMKKAKIRSLHSNNKDVDSVTPGQRTAVSFTGIEKEILIRGGVIIDDLEHDKIVSNQVLALSIEILENFKHTIIDQRKMLLILGTSEIEGEIRMYNPRELRAGQSGIIFFKPDNPLYAMIGDNYIGRLPTPMVTVGGGQILDRFNHFPKRKEIKRLSYLSDRLQMNNVKLIKSELQKHSIVNVENLLSDSVYSKSEIEKQIQSLWNKKEIELFEGAIYNPSDFDKFLSVFKNNITKELESKSHLSGLTFEQILSTTGFEKEQVDLTIRYLIKNGGMIQQKETFNLTGRDMSLKGQIKKAYDEIIIALNEQPYNPPVLTKIASKGKIYKEAIKFIIDTKQGYKCGSEFVFLDKIWKEIIGFISNKLNENNKITVADIRDKFGFSRKYVIPILEETDRLKLTKREGDIRTKGADFESKKFNL
jgi:selenocysteine-specific elongation factor